MSTFDPDLEEMPTRAVNPYGETVSHYQRLLANPFPTILGLLCVWGLLNHALRVRSLPYFLGALTLFAASPWLIQYHCLDCGGTGFALRAGRHACEPTLRRWGRAGAITRPLPSLRAQVRVWIGVLAAVTLIYALAKAGNR